MDEERDYAALLPRTPPEGMVSWLMGRGHLLEHCLIYRHEYAPNPATGRRVRAVRLTCTACGESTLAERVSGEVDCRYGRVTFGFAHPDTGETICTGEKTTCPMCGAEVRAEHVSLLDRGFNFHGVFCLTVGRVEDCLTLTRWYLEKRFTAAGEEKVVVYAYEAAVVEQTRLVRMSGCFQCMGGTTWYEKWQQRRKFLNKIDKAGNVFPYDPALLTGSTAENSALDRYLRDCGEEAHPASYLRLWQKRRHVENLVVQGAARLVNEMLRAEAEAAQYSGRYYSSRSYSAIPRLRDVNWRERRPAQMLGLTKDEFRECVRMGWDTMALNLYRQAGARGIRLALPADMEDCIAAGSLWCIRQMEDGNRFLYSARYLRRQRSKHPDEAVRLDGNYLSDYWSMAQRVGMDLTDEHLRYPRDIVAAHDRALEADQERRRRADAELARKQAELAAKKEAEQRVQFSVLAERLAPLAWEADGILIRCAATPEELTEEGRALSHCVGGYRAVHAIGKKPIFFIRRAAEPDKPWYTLQLDLARRSVIQNRGKCNCAETEEVVRFKEKWLEHIRGIRLRERVRVTA